MYLYGEKAEFAAEMCRTLFVQAAASETETDGMRVLQMLAGVLVETLLLFDEPDQGLEATYATLAQLLRCEPRPGHLSRAALPPAYILDFETEQGRVLAKCLFEEWLDCAYEFHDLVLFVLHNVIVRLEQAGQPRDEVFRVFIECANRGLGFELAAQELCETVMGAETEGRPLTLPECVSGLCAVSGRLLALSQDSSEFSGVPYFSEKLDQITHVMTQEAIRLGVPAGSDWRFGLAANDYPPSAPYGLIHALEPLCLDLFGAIGLPGLVDRSVAAAKAAGRMLAIAAGGEWPDIPPVIAKPLAIGAMTDTYRTVCRDEMIVSC